jgi:predicted Zn finger-like uncharacterized protein
MQFVCNNCKAKYDIPANRVQGRILKIRCRECGNVIEIRGDALPPAGGPSKKGEAAAATGRVAKPAPSLLKDKFKASFTAAKPLGLGPPVPKRTAIPKPPTRADKLLKLAQKAEARALEMKEVDKWYVAIKSSPVGPVNKAKIRAYIRKADLTLASLVWREGFTDWKPLRTVPELKQIYDDIKEEIQRPDHIDIAARLKRAATLTPEARRKGPPAPPPAGARPAAPAGPQAPPTELAPLDALMSVPPPADAQQAGAPSSVVDEALRGYYVGRIDGQGTVPGVETVRPSYVAEYMPQGYPEMEEPEPLVRRLIHSRLFLLIGGASALMAGFAIMIIAMLALEKDDEKEPANVVKEENSVQQPLVQSTEKADDGDLLAGLIISVEEVLAAEEAEAAGTNSVKSSGGGKGKKKTTESVFKTTVMDMPDVEETSISSSALKKKVTEKSSGGSSQGQNGLSDEQIKSTVISKSKTIQRCYEKVLGKGMGIDDQIKVKVKVNVGTSGKVTKVKVISVSKYGNFLTPCIENGIKTWTFPRSDAPSEFIFPVLLTPKS